MHHCHEWYRLLHMLLILSWVMILLLRNMDSSLLYRLLSYLRIRLKNSKYFFLFASNHLCWKLFFKVICSTHEIISMDSKTFCKLTSLCRSSSTSTDKNYFFLCIDFIHSQRKEMKGDITSLFDMDLIIFSDTSYVYEFDIFFFEDDWEFFWGDREHILIWLLVTKYWLQTLHELLNFWITYMIRHKLTIFFRVNDSFIFHFFEKLRELRLRNYAILF